jgi:hypothetical protein
MRPDTIPSAAEMKTLIPRAAASRDPDLLRRWFRGAVYYHAKRGRPRYVGSVIAESLVWAGLAAGLAFRGSWILGALVAAVGILRVSWRPTGGLGLSDEEAAELALSQVVRDIPIELEVTGVENGRARV